MTERMRALEAGEDPGICPYVYKMFVRDNGGHYFCTLEIPADKAVPNA